MDIKHAERKVLPLALLENNDGQIIGVPRNPRYITEDEYAALKKSIEKDDLTGLLQLIVYPHADKYVVLGGNMRLRALRELGYKEVECAIVPSDADDYTLRKIVQLDNSTFGEYDMDILANEWNVDELKEWGVDVPDIGGNEKENEKPEVPFSEVLDEEHNYLVLYFDNGVDWLQAQTIFNIEPVMSLSTRTDGVINKGNKMIGIGRVINGTKFIKKLLEKNENKC